MKSKKGFTLVEAMMTFFILAIIGTGFLKLYREGIYMWHIGTTKMKIYYEARTTIALLTKFVQECQGSTIEISRLDSNQPVNSYIGAFLAETVYVTDTQSNCCGSGSSYITAGSAGDYFKIYQYNNYLLATWPEYHDPLDPSNVTYKTITITSNLDFINFTFKDSVESKVVSVGVQISKRPLANLSPVSFYLKKDIVIKHFHSAGYYGN